MGGGGIGDIGTLLGDVFTGGAISAKKAREQAEADAKKQEKGAKRRLTKEQQLAANEEARAGESARLKSEKRQRAAGTTVKTSPAGLTTAAPGTPKTLLGQ